MAKLLYKCMTKGTKNEKGTLSHSQNWISARRAFFKIYEESLECGDWIFSTSRITNAILYNTKQFFIPLQVLQFDIDTETYQFGFNPWNNPSKYFSFPFKEEDVKLKHSLFSIIVRTGLILYLLYSLWQYYFLK